MAKLVRFLGLLAIGLALATGPAMAAGGGSKAAPPDPNYAKARALIDAGSYGDAIPFLEKAVTANPKSADAYNYLGYSHRKIGQIDAALENYRRALELQPKHLGANEYLGELYLELGELAKAEERLDVLDDACFFGCEEYSELKELIKDYKKRQGAS
jgi:tetratricopeptide (TPR) repeat protein